MSDDTTTPQPAAPTTAMEKTIALANSHKTKILGAATIACSYLQASNLLPTLMSPQAYGWTTLALGVGTLVCGFLNTSQDK